MDFSEPPLLQLTCFGPRISPLQIKLASRIAAKRFPRSFLMKPIAKRGCPGTKTHFKRHYLDVYFHSWVDMHGSQPMRGHTLTHTETQSQKKTSEMGTTCQIGIVAQVWCRFLSDLGQTIPAWHRRGKGAKVFLLQFLVEEWIVPWTRKPLTPRSPPLAASKDCKGAHQAMVRRPTEPVATEWAFP